ncbi:STAS domain-containing protein [Streptomyces roseolus]|uniref:STAS domain-containing protein n=2 Tax=Streptomyces TaxID=1883 RepID=UPI00364BFB25
MEANNPRIPSGEAPRVALHSARRVYRAVNGHARVERVGNEASSTWFLRAAGEFDADTVACLREAVGDARRDDAERILLDVYQVGFWDSTFLHALVEAHRGPAGLVLVGPLPFRIRRLFEITGTLRLFPLATDRGASGFV